MYVDTRSSHVTHIHKSDDHYFHAYAFVSARTNALHTGFVGLTVSRGMPSNYFDSSCFSSLLFFRLGHVFSSLSFRAVLWQQVAANVFFRFQVRRVTSGVKTFIDSLNHQRQSARSRWHRTFGYNAKCNTLGKFGATEHGSLV